jgi:periplasmic nitrate reductase NapE
VAPQDPDGATSADAVAVSKGDETFAFVFLSFVLFPILAIVFVGGFGFILWMLQLIYGPPGS